MLAKFGLVLLVLVFFALAFSAGTTAPGALAQPLTQAMQAVKQLAAKQRLAATAGAAYGALRAEVKDPTYTIAGLARQAQLAEDFADALATTSIPASVRSNPAAVDAYCEALTSAAAPLEAEARAGFTACLDVARDLSWSSSWSQLCERALGQLAPEDYPAAAELRPAPATSAPPPTLAPPSQGLDSAR